MTTPKPATAEPQSIDKRYLVPAVGCYAFWGLFPAYWKFLDHIDALETLMHRVVWSFIFYLVIMFIRQSWGKPFRQAVSWNDWKLALITGLLMSTNWWLFIYAVNSDQIIETSLAYFINPLMVVAVGVFWFKEPFPILLKIAFILVVIGVGLKVVYGETFPWIAMILAVSFCIYGAIKKTVTVNPAQFSLMENAVILLPALVLGSYLRAESEMVLTTTDWALLAGGGIFTGIPLLLFATAAQRLPYGLMGMLQFIGPTIAFLLAYHVYGERINLMSWVAFGFIWCGVVVYIADRILVAARLRQRSRVPLATPEEPQ